MAINNPGFTPAPETFTYSGYYTLVAWSIVILIIMLIAKTRIGYTILFFFCIASIIIVLAVGSPTIVSIFNKAQGK